MTQMQNRTAEYLREHVKRYPRLQVRDCLKALHQSAFGCGHLIDDPAAAAEFIAREAAGCAAPKGEGTEALDGAYCRVHLHGILEGGLRPETFAKLFALSAGMPGEDERGLEQRLQVLERLTREGEMPFSSGELAKELAAWRAEGYPACHHSEQFWQAYRPAYRVLRQEHAALLPVLTAIDSLMTRQGKAIVALEGGSASGKTTLSGTLGRLYSCNVFHMDDYYLRPEQRTAQRLAQTGGNVDRERFYEEILAPLTRGEDVVYRPYNCGTGQLDAPIRAPYTPLSIVEGAYSMHPELAPCYDLSVFLQVEPQRQRERILRRNGAQVGARFFSTWIPLEHAYFEETNTRARCDMTLEILV